MGIPKHIPMRDLDPKVVNVSHFGNHKPHVLIAVPQMGHHHHIVVAPQVIVHRPHVIAVPQVIVQQPHVVIAIPRHHHHHH